MQRDLQYLPLHGLIDASRLKSSHSLVTAGYLGQPLPSILPSRQEGVVPILSILEAQYMRETADVLMEKAKLLEEARVLDEFKIRRAIEGRILASQGILPAQMPFRDPSSELRSKSPESNGHSYMGTKNNLTKDRTDFSTTVPPAKDLRMKQDNSWETRFNELLQFKSKTGHCDVPRRFKPNPKLGVWVCSLRQQRTRGTLNEAKIERLNIIGFKWRITVIKGAQINPQIAKSDTWNERFKLLLSFKRIHGHCNVPCVHKKLCKWVQQQRRQKKAGKLTAEKVAQLDAIEFDWKSKN